MSDIGKVLFKIIQGPNSGALVVLGTAKLVVGRSFDCDLVLADSDVSDQHFEIWIQEGLLHLRLLSEDKSMLVAGEEVQGTSSFQLEDIVKFKVGLTWIAVGLEDSNWSKVNDIEVGDESKVIEEPQSQPEKKKTEQVENKVKEKFRGVLRTKKYILSSVVAASVLLIIGLCFTFMIDDKPEQEISVDPMKELNVLVSKYDVNVNFNEHGLAIEGYADSKEEIKMFKNDLEKISLKQDVRLKINVRSEILEGCQRLAKMYHVPVKIRFLDPGIVQLSGYVNDKKSYEYFKLSLFRDLAGVNRINEHVIYSDVLQSKIGGFLKSYELDSQIKLKLNAKTVSLSGTIPTSMASNWRVFQNEVISGKYGDSVPFRKNVDILGGKQFIEKVGGIRIESIHFSNDRHSWIKTRSGRKLFSGTALNDNYLIKKIEKNEIILLKDNKEIRLEV